MENRKLGGHLGFCPKTERFTPNSGENFSELKKDSITIPRMYGLLWIKFIPGLPSFVPIEFDLWSGRII